MSELTFMPQMNSPLPSIPSPNFTPQTNSPVPSTPSPDFPPFLPSMSADIHAGFDAHLDARFSEIREYPEPNLNTLAFYPTHVPHMYVNMSQAHWDELNITEHVCSVCHEHFKDNVTELNCTQGKEGKHFFCHECADAWWLTCLNSGTAPKCACCRTITSNAVTWVRPIDM
jgi:hypothetical protein